MRQLSAQCESKPDYFMRRSWLRLLDKVRSQVADMIGAEPDECVIVPNTTHGINTIVSNVEWAEGDKIVICRCTFSARNSTRNFARGEDER
jgi:selenocysteine lyase/cysteine desulfurase